MRGGRCGWRRQQMLWIHVGSSTTISSIQTSTVNIQFVVTQMRLMSKFDVTDIALKTWLRHVVCATKKNFQERKQKKWTNNFQTSLNDKLAQPEHCLVHWIVRHHRCVVREILQQHWHRLVVFSIVRQTIRFENISIVCKRKWTIYGAFTVLQDSDNGILVLNWMKQTRISWSMSRWIFFRNFIFLSHLLNTKKQLPGVKEEDVSVELHKGVLTVSGKKSSKNEKKG